MYTIDRNRKLYSIWFTKCENRYYQLLNKIQNIEHQSSMQQIKSVRCASHNLCLYFKILGQLPGSPSFFSIDSRR